LNELLDIGFLQARQYVEGKWELKYLRNKSIQGILLSCYRLLVTQGKCKRIEDLTIEEKHEIWEQSKEVDGSVEVCRCIQALITLIKLKYEGETR
jgi:hypothetical protein